jgi:glucose dehydrogenase-like enzyme
VPLDGLLEQEVYLSYGFLVRWEDPAASEGLEAAPGRRSRRRQHWTGRGYVFGLTCKPYLNSDFVEAVGARYESTHDLPILEGTKKYGPFDIVFEATGFSPVVFDGMQVVGKKSVMILSSVTGGSRKFEIPC